MTTQENHFSQWRQRRNKPKVTRLRSTVPQPGQVRPGKNKEAARLTSRRIMVCGCLDEIRQGNSIIKLYASLLVQALLDAEPILKRENQSEFVDMQDEAIDESDINYQLPICYSLRGRLGPWEREFILNMVEIMQRSTPSQKQVKWVKDIFQRLTRESPATTR